MQLHSGKVRIKNKKFHNRIKGIKKERILGCSVDWSKSFHKVMLFDFNGKILVKPFEIDTLRSGYDKLLRTIQKQERRIKTKKVFIIIEPSGSWANSLILNLGKDFEDLWLVNPAQTASNRKEKLVLGLKTDDIDLCSLADLLIRGECYKYYTEKGHYTALKLRVYWRDNKILMRTQLKNQLCNRLSKIYPLVADKNKKSRHPNTYVFERKIFRYLLKLNLSPNEVSSLSDRQLKDIFSKEKSHVSSRYANTFKKAFNTYLAPPNNIVKRELELLNKDISLYEMLNKEINATETEMIEMVNLTEGRYLLKQIRGIADLQVANYIGLIGAIKKYETAKQIFSLSGLAPTIKESGGKIIKGFGIKRRGNKHLGVSLFKTAMSVILNEPYFYSYFRHLRRDMKKPYKKAVIGVAKKLNNVMFAMIRDRKPFKPPPCKPIMKTSTAGKSWSIS